jgi:hypothetical protein
MVLMTIRLNPPLWHTRLVAASLPHEADCCYMPSCRVPMGRVQFETKPTRPAT